MAKRNLLTKMINDYEARSHPVESDKSGRNLELTVGPKSFEAYFSKFNCSIQLKIVHNLQKHLLYVFRHFKIFFEKSQIKLLNFFK